MCPSKTELQDSLAIRYGRCIPNTPSKCDGCGEDVTVQHALSCKKGGLVTLRHNEIRDTIGDLSNMLWNSVRREPVIRDASAENTGLVAHLMIRGAWERQHRSTASIEASFDIRVTDTDALSYQTRSPEAVLKSAEKEKKNKYRVACEERHITFTPLVCSVDSALAPEFDIFLKRLAAGLAIKWDRKYSDVMNWVCTKALFGILRATNVCVRGTRTKWRSLRFEDGASFSRET